MSTRTQQIVRTLLVCLLASGIGAVVKILYGNYTNTLAFVADGIHSLLDSSSTIIGIVSIILASKPPDAEHPYGHHKFETVAALAIAFMLVLAAYEVGSLAYTRLVAPSVTPEFSYWGLVILMFVMSMNLGLARYEAKKSKELKSQFLMVDSFHNQSDFLVSIAVLASLLSAHFEMHYVDSLVSLGIAAYLVVLSIRLIGKTLKPLVDHSVLNIEEVEAVTRTVPEVLHCHAIRSRGQDGHLFLDLNIHLSGQMTLEKAHRITHTVEDRLKERFPDLVDVVIHTEPHGHPPCCKDKP